MCDIVLHGLIASHKQKILISIISILQLLLENLASIIIILVSWSHNVIKYSHVLVSDKAGMATNL